MVGGGGLFIYTPLWSPFWGGGGYYGNYDYPYDNSYAYSTPVPYEAQYAPDDQQPVEEPAAPPTEFGEQAMQAFAAGDYRSAARLAQHAVVDNPQGPRPREVLSLALFAQGEYRGAAVEAHYALLFGAPADWPTLYRYYNNLGTYSRQVDALAKVVRENRDAPEAQFLLAYHNLMMGHKQAAADGFSRALALAPNDDVAQKMVKQLGGTPPLTATPPPPVPDKGPAEAAPAQKSADDPSATPPPEPKAAAR